MQTSNDSIFENNVNIEIIEDIYLNYGMLEVFSELNKKLEFIKVINMNGVKYIRYQFNFIAGKPIDVLMNTKINYVEFIYHHTISKYVHEELILSALSMINKRMIISRAVHNDEQDVRFLHIDAVYSGEYSKITFKEFVDSYIKDVYNMHGTLAFFEISISKKENVKRDNQSIKTVNTVKKRSKKKRDISYAIEEIVDKYYA